MGPPLSFHNGKPISYLAAFYPCHLHLFFYSLNWKMNGYDSFHLYTATLREHHPFCFQLFYHHCSVDDVSWFDESRFQLYYADGRVRILRQPCESMDSTCQSGGACMISWVVCIWHDLRRLWQVRKLNVQSPTTLCTFRQIWIIQAGQCDILHVEGYYRVALEILFWF